MILTAFGLLAVSQTPTKPLKATIESLSVFKNGYAVVTRAIPIKGAGEVNLDSFPQASYGTLWFAATGGAKLESVRIVRDFQSMNSSGVAPSNWDGLLGALQKRPVKITLRHPEGGVTPLEGTVHTVSGELVYLRTAKGTVAAPIKAVTQVNVLDQKPLPELKFSNLTERRLLRIKTSGGAGQVRMLSLERGLSWTPGYFIDIADPKELTLISKATIINDLEPFTGAETRLVTGFPNLPYALVIDPFVLGVSPGMAGGFGMGGGGFGGGAANMMTQNAALPAPIAQEAFARMDTNNPMANAGESVGDLFFYRLPALGMALGERRWEILFRAKSPYEHIYLWNVTDTPANDGERAYQDVWHSLAFRNTSGRPLTTASAVVMDGEKLLGQGMIGYVPNGAPTELTITKALDVQAQSNNEVESLERGFEKFSDGTPRFNRVTTQTTMRVVNRKDKTVTLRIVKPYVGDVVEATDNPSTQRGERTRDNLNLSGTLTWTISLAPNEERVVTLRTRMLTPYN